MKLIMAFLLLAIAFNDSLADYSVYSLPNPHKSIIPKGKLSYTSKRVVIKGTKVTEKKPNIDATDYVFAKKAYVSEKRDQAIKLLRQEAESGSRKNLDNVLLRLGQLYVEKYMELSVLESQYYSDKQKSYQKLVDSGQKVKKAPKLDHSRSRRYLTSALKTFDQLEKKYPKYRRVDEVIFFVGFVNMEFGRVRKGVRNLERLIKSYPKSNKYFESVLYLADHYFDKLKFKSARSKYGIILGRKSSEFYNYALYKNAWCQLNIGNKKTALAQMKTLIERLETDKQKANFNLKEQALRDLVAFFADLERVDEALAYFKDKVGEKVAWENLKIIAATLLAKNRDRSSVKAYGMLVKEFGDEIDGPRMHVALYQVKLRLGKYKSAVIIMDNALIKYGSKSDWAEDWIDKKPKDAKSQLEMIENEAINSAYYFHHTAQKTKNKKYYEQALVLYRSIAKNFPGTKDRRKYVFYQGEILYKQKKWLASSEIYLQVANAKPQDKLAEESLYNALLALDNLTLKSSKLKRFTKEEMKSLSTEEKNIPKGEKKFIEVAQNYLGRYPKMKRAIDIRFRIASIYYRYHHFDEALVAFKDIATKHPRHKSAKTSAYVVLDIYNIKKDYNGLEKAALAFSAVKGLSNKKFRGEMGNLRSEIAFKKIEKFENDKKWEDAGDAYLAFHKKNRRSKLSQKALYNAVISFERSTNLARTAEVSHLFLKKYPRDPYSKGLLLKQAQMAEKRFDFATSQKLYLSYYTKYPKDDQGISALYNAAVFAEILERNTTATKLYKKYLRSGRVTKAEKDEILRRQVNIYARARNWRKVGEAFGLLYRSASTKRKKAEVLADQADLYERKNRRSDRNAVINRVKNLTGFTGGVKTWGRAIRHVAEWRFSYLGKARLKYDRIKLKFPVQTLSRNLLNKKSALVKLSESYDRIIRLGVPEWGVAALYKKGSAYESFVKGYRSLKIPRKYRGEQKKQLEKELAQGDLETIVALEKKAEEIFDVCRQKAAEFLVVGDYASKCFRAGKASAVASRPSGLIPRSSYWTSRWIR